MDDTVDEAREGGGHEIERWHLFRLDHVETNALRVSMSPTTSHHVCNI